MSAAAPTANWSYPTSIRFGAGRISELPEACASAGISNPLLVTDRGLAELEPTRRALGILEAAGLSHSLFSEVDPNPDESNLSAGVEAFRSGGHDGVVALGGGSGLDLGKLVAFMAGQTRPVWDFEDVGDRWTRADCDSIAPVVAVPTTAGTGSEVGRAGVLTDSRSHAKKIIFHPKILPGAVVCDPELTLSMPKPITAGTGLDAFAHCVEAFSSPHYHPMSQGIALEGMRLVKEWLPRACADGSDLEARANMMSAAIMGAVAFQKGLGAIHAISHPVGAMFGTHHGTTNAIAMPAVLELNAPAIAGRFENAAAWLGIEGGFDGFRAFALELNRSMGIPEKMREIGVDPERIDEIAAMALEDPSCAGNPVPLTLENLRELLEACV